MANHTVLSEEQLALALQELPEWSVQNGMLYASFTFSTFLQAIAFINAVAQASEEMNHHPEFCNSYNKVSFSFCTHDVGDQITDTDVKMAQTITSIARNMG